MSESNVHIIHSIYAAFGRGDSAGVQHFCAPDTHWDFDVGASDVPWHRPVHGVAEVARFLGDFVENVTLEAFEPRELICDGAHVVVHVAIAYTVRRSGRRVAMDQLHWWSLGGGRVTRLRHFEDTAQVLAAWHDR